MTQKPETAILGPASIYFGLVFGAGFVLGLARTLLLVPRVGERAAELIEMPLMLVAVTLAARSVVRRTRAPAPARHLALGMLALLFLVLAELAVVQFVRRQALGEYVAERDPVSGAAYLLALAWFALAPAVLGSSPLGGGRRR